MQLDRLHHDGSKKSIALVVNVDEVMNHALVMGNEGY